MVLLTKLCSHTNLGIHFSRCNVVAHGTRSAASDNRLSAPFVLNRYERSPAFLAYQSIAAFLTSGN